MKINKILIVSAIVLMSFAGNLLKGEAEILDYAGEMILYVVRPLGKSEYNDLGLVDLNGMKVNLITFKTKVLLVRDTEKIYSEPKTLLPYRIERTISKLIILKAGPICLKSGSIQIRGFR